MKKGIITKTDLIKIRAKVKQHLERKNNLAKMLFTFRKMHHKHNNQKELT
jgi:hypothetical protein